jgi:hypothetical protein
MYRVQCSIVEASLGRYATHQYNPFYYKFILTLTGWPEGLNPYNNYIRLMSLHCMHGV